MKALYRFACLLVVTSLFVEVRADDAATFNAADAWAEFESQFRLFYAYIERDDFEFEDVLSRKRQAAESTENAEAFRRVIDQGMRAWTDSHLSVRPADTRWNYVPSNADLIIRRKQDSFVVQDVRAGSAAAVAGVRPGWELLSVGEESALEVAREVLGHFVTEPTERQLEYAATLAANGRPVGQRSLQFRTPADKVETIDLPSPGDFSRELASLPLVSVSRVDNVAVIRVNNSLGNNDTIQAFDDAMQQAIDAPAIIVDLRGTPGGGNTEVARSILGHFVSDVRSYQVHEIPSLEREFTVPRRFIEQVKPRQPLYLDKPVVVLGGYWTGSMGEGLVIGFDAATDAHMIASDMADLLGGMIRIDLQQSSAQLWVGRESLFHVDGTPRELFEAEHALPSADMDEDGNDPAMRAALAHLRSVGLEDIE